MREQQVVLLHLLVQGSMFEARLLRGGELPERGRLAAACHNHPVRIYALLRILVDVGEAGLVFYVAQQRQP